jgi:hypothetical protein
MDNSIFQDLRDAVRSLVRLRGLALGTPLVSTVSKQLQIATA